MPDGSSAILAQLVEHITRNDEVVGSIPTNGSRTNKGLPFDAVALFSTVNAVLAPVALKQNNHWSNHLKIWIDADACPRVIKEIVFRASERLDLPVLLVANKELTKHNS